MTPQQFFLILRARYKVALITLLVTMTIAIAITILLPKQYTANAAVVLDVKSPDPVSGQMLSGMIAPGYMATQIDIINSQRVAQQVAKLLPKGEGTWIRRQWQEDTEGKGDFDLWLTNLLEINLNAKPARDSNVINISYTGADADFAAAAANAFSQAYLDINVDLKLAPARQYATFFDEQTKQTREKLEKAQKALSTYQQENGIVSADERLDFETAKLNDTSSQLTVIQGQTTDSESKRKNSKADTVAEVMQSPLINGLKADIARLDAKLQDSNVILGKNHPQTQRTEAELAMLRTQLDAETRKITSSIDTTYQVSKQREQQLQSALATQKARVLVLNKQRDELNVLRHDIDTAQRAYETLSQRASQTNVESQNGQTNISVLNAALTPTRTSKPRTLLNIVLAIFMGSLLGVGLAVVLELLNRRVRSTYDLVEALNLPVLGSIASASTMIKRSGPGKLAALTSNGART